MGDLREEEACLPGGLGRQGQIWNVQQGQFLYLKGRVLQVGHAVNGDIGFAPVYRPGGGFVAFGLAGGRSAAVKNITVFGDLFDPLAAELRDIADAHGGDVAAYVRALSGIAEIFGDDLAENAEFVQAVTRALSSLYDIGARATVAAYNKG